MHSFCRGGGRIYADYDDRTITLHIFHGLSDFRGICAFLKTLLKYYFCKLGLAETELPEADSADTIPCFENILEAGASGDTIGYFVPNEETVFHLPEENFGKHTTMHHICEIDVPLEPILALSKQNESSVVPTVEAFIGRAIRKTYDVGEKVVIGYTPVDLRPIFHFQTSGNGSSNFPIPYTEKMDRYSLSERAKHGDGPFVSVPVSLYSIQGDGNKRTVPVPPCSHLTRRSSLLCRSGAFPPGREARRWKPS